MKKQITTSVAASNDNNTPARPRSKLVNSIYRWIRINRTTSILRDLDDGVLEDIGINRDDIRNAAVKIIDQQDQPAA